MSGWVWDPPILTQDPNEILGADVSFNGIFYAYPASGGYDIEQGASSITLLPYDQIQRYDLTDAVQVAYDVRTFNMKIGLIKDSSNINVLHSEFNPITQFYPTSDITISANDFLTGLTPSQIISVGKYRTLYYDFISFASNYFGFSDGFNSLFNITSEFNINGGVFDSNAFMNIIRGRTYNTSTHEYINDLSGNITVSNINALLRSVVYTDPFNNRSASGKTMEDGFLENDIIFVPNGTKVTLTVDIINNDITPTDQYTPERVDGYKNDYVNGLFSQTTTVTNTNITRVITAPLVFRLMNLTSYSIVFETIEFNASIGIVGFELPVDLSGNPYLTDIILQTLLQTAAHALGVDISSLSVNGYTLTGQIRVPRSAGNVTRTRLRGNKDVIVGNEILLNILVQVPYEHVQNVVSNTTPSLLLTNYANNLKQACDSGDLKTILMDKAITNGTTPNFNVDSTVTTTIVDTNSLNVILPIL